MSRADVYVIGIVSLSLFFHGGEVRALAQTIKLMGMYLAGEAGGGKHQRTQVIRWPLAVTWCHMINDHVTYIKGIKVSVWDSQCYWAICNLPLVSLNTLPHRPQRIIDK